MTVSVYHVTCKLAKRVIYVNYKRRNEAAKPPAAINISDISYSIKFLPFNARSFLDQPVKLTFHIAQSVSVNWIK